MKKNKILMYLFIASEAFFFLALIIAYVYYSYTGGKLSESASYLDIKKTSIFTFLLVSSSLTIFFAESKLRQNRRKLVLIWLGATIALGIVFLVGQAMEYLRLIELNITVSRNVFGSAFFTLTGFHGLHVLIGIVVLSIIFLIVYSEKFRKIEFTTFQSISVYWHFVDAVWIIVFSVIYIGAII